MFYKIIYLLTKNMNSNILGDKILKIKVNGDPEVSDSINFKGGKSSANPLN